VNSGLQFYESILKFKWTWWFIGLLNKKNQFDSKILYDIYDNKKTGAVDCYANRHAFMEILIGHFRL
jgi:hypothetical protein